MVFKKIFIFHFLLLSLCSFGQRQSSSDWHIGIGGDVVRFNNSELMKDKHTLQMPRFNVTKNFTEILSLDTAISFGAFDSALFFTNNIPYFSFDISGRYRYLLRYEELNPYIFIGGSMVNASLNDGFGKTINAGTGVTYWFAKNIGVNGQVYYKHSLDQSYLSSHIQVAASLIFGFNGGNRNRNGSARCYYSPTRKVRKRRGNNSGCYYNR